ncbi:MAG: hypothetical protein KDA21_01665 [Phycisphaerales bacterium]|nr:hypothetical protein [Phycisphaerales bacterium]
MTTPVAHDAPVKVVCFDLGGVVVQLNFTFEGACATAGVPVRESGRVDDPQHHEVRWRLYDAHQKGELPCADMWPLLALTTNGRYSAAEMSRIFRAVVLEDHPGVADLIEELNGLGLVTACLSNTNAAHIDPLLGGHCEIIKPSPALARMQHHGVSHRMASAKPGATIYRRFEREIGARGSQILFFDDRMENVIAARGLGWRAEWIDHDEATVPQLRGWLERHGVRG